jgi:hypothetical protein
MVSRAWISSAGEPQARQFVLRTDPLSALLEAVAAQAAVENEWAIQTIAHVGEAALERRPGDAETFLQFLAGHRYWCAPRIWSIW